VPKAVGKDFSEASKGMKFGKGSGNRADAQAINKPKTKQGKSELFAKGGEMAESKAMVKKEVSFMKKKGAPASMIKHEESEMKTKKMAKGGMTASKMGAVKTAAPSRDGVATKGKTKGKMIVMPGNKGMKNGGKC
jgi:23S rRNA A1618 N6-methylase RlmF